MRLDRCTETKPFQQNHHRTHRFSKSKPKNPTPAYFKTSKKKHHKFIPSIHEYESHVPISPLYSKAHLFLLTLIFYPKPQKNLLKLFPTLASGCKVANCPKTSVFLSAIACFACSGAKSTCAMAFNDPGLGDSTKLQLATKIGLEKSGIQMDLFGVVVVGGFK